MIIEQLELMWKTQSVGDVVKELTVNCNSEFIKLVQKE